MAQVTVEQLAKVVGASTERLLSQMKEAGLAHTSASQEVSDEEKQTLLQFLKRNHGDASSAAPRKITLQRKTLSTLRTSGSGGRKTVNVEVRKKRTYVKRDELEPQEAGPVTEEIAVEVVAAEPEITINAAAGAPVVDEAVDTEPAATSPETEVIAESVDPEDAEPEGDVDPEVLRQRAALRRKQEELGREQLLREKKEREAEQAANEKAQQAEKAAAAARDAKAG